MDDASITGALNDQMPRLAVVCPPIKIPGYVPAFCKCWYSGFNFSHYDLPFPTRYCIPYV